MINALARVGLTKGEGAHRVGKEWKLETSKRYLESEDEDPLDTLLLLHLTRRPSRRFPAILEASISWRKERREHPAFVRARRGERPRAALEKDGDGALFFNELERKCFAASRAAGKA